MRDAAGQFEDVGQSVGGRYRVEEVLGRGGMAAVYRVRDERTGRKLALKRGWARDPAKALKRQTLLQREYHTLAQLAHPRIIEVYDYGVDERGPYYTMELLDGADLDQRGRQPWKQACALLRDVASSLAILHSRGLIHRDVSARNVRITADGRAKLIDFGAMASMGVAKDVVGTPPFTSPEVLQMQALDARADLFSLGALGYYLLTGRHAFPTRRMSELRDVWRSTPAAPQRFAADVPPALSALIMQLLSLDRSARPQSVAELMGRLCAIADLPAEEQAAVSRAYLTTPILVGRDRALIDVRKHMLSLARGDGASLRVEGIAGSGRSRLLDACALEGKLLGATVVRADAGDGASGDWGVARALGAQLLELMPDQAQHAARLSRDVLGHVIDGLRGDASAVEPERSLLIRELRDFVLTLAREQRLLLLIDDADGIDDPSAALLAALAHKTDRHSLILVLAVEPDSQYAATASLRLLRSLAVPVELPPLTPAQTEELMRSVFGDVVHLSLIAGRIHALAQGSPRATMELAQHLCNRGLARYEAGRWSLPSRLDDRDLPSSLQASLAGRLAELGAEARELADVLCLADRDALTLAIYPKLVHVGEQSRVFALLDELVAARVLVADADRYRFSQRGFLAVLQESMPQARKQAIHARLADLLARSGGDLLRRADHLLLSGREREAIELLASLDLPARLPPLPLLEQAVERAGQLGLAARTIHDLRVAIVLKAPLVMAIDSFRRAVFPLLAQLEQDSGLKRYRELTEVPEAERLPQALRETQQHYLEAPERNGVYPVVDAIRELARLSTGFLSVGMMTFDLEFAESLPSVVPFVPLSTALQVVELAAEGIKQWLRGRFLRAQDAYEQVLARIAEPDRAGLDDAGYLRVRMGIHFLLGLVKAARSIASAQEHAEVLETDRAHRVNAWRVRMLLQLSYGNAQEATKCLRRAELLQLQDGIELSYMGTTPAMELVQHVLAGDLLGILSTLDAIAVFAERYPGWRPFLLYGQASARRLQGDPQGALEIVLRGLELAPPTRHCAYAGLAGAHVGALNDLGRHAEAVEVGRAHIEICKREELVLTGQPLHVATALALARLGEFAPAVQMIEATIKASEQRGQAGLSLGTIYEARAQIAAWSGDREAFERYAELCADEYRKGKNAVLSARVARLMEEARKHELGAVEEALPISRLLAISGTDTGYETIHSRMLECVDRGDRARCALTMLLQDLESFAGYLYGLNGEQLQLLAGLPETAPEPAMDEWVRAQIRLELYSLPATLTGEPEEDAAPGLPPARYIDEEGRTFEPLYLGAIRDQEERLAAVLVLHVSAGPRSVPDKRLLAEIADHLLAHGDVVGAVLSGQPRTVSG